MTATRTVRATSPSRPTEEGAGVHLRRAFGFGSEQAFDPFLMLDDFRSTDPESYLPGFPWHPHRGIETITYVITGRVEHGDSMENAGVIHAGDVQWMTAGSGVIHQEMPKGDELGAMGGFQLWANLPASHKMMDPRYRSIHSDDIPQVDADGAHVRVIAGTVVGVQGPVRDIVIEPEYLDVTLEADARWAHPTSRGHTVFAYLFEGDACFGPDDLDICANEGMTLLFSDGEEFAAHGGPAGARFLLVSGKPLGEPIAWRGPIVMNTEDELRQAFAEYRDGTFIKTGTDPR